MILKIQTKHKISMFSCIKISRKLVYFYKQCFCDIIRDNCSSYNWSFTVTVIYIFKRDYNKENYQIKPCLGKYSKTKLQKVEV